MPREFDFHKDRMNMLAGLVEEDDFEETRQNLAEEYRKEMNEDIEEVSSTLKEYTSYMGYKPADSEGEQGVDCECPEEARPPEEAGLPGWSYYDADPTYSKLSTMEDDLQHKKELQWVAPLDSELEGEDDDDMDEVDATAAFKAKVSGMINEHEIIHGTLYGPGFGPSVIEHGWGVKEAEDDDLIGSIKKVSGAVQRGKEQPDLPGELEDRDYLGNPKPERGMIVRSLNKIRRPQGGKSYSSVTIEPGTKGKIVTADDRTITVVFDKPYGNVIQWTGRDKDVEFWRVVTLSR